MTHHALRMGDAAVASTAQDDTAHTAREKASAEALNERTSIEQTKSGNLPAGFPAAHQLLADDSTKPSPDSCGPYPTTGHFTIDLAEKIANGYEHVLEGGLNYIVQHPKAAAAEAVGALGLGIVAVVAAPEVAGWTGAGLLAAHVTGITSAVYSGMAREVVGKANELDDWQACKDKEAEAHLKNS